MNTKYTDGNLNGCLFLSNPIKIPQTPNYKLLAKKLWGVRSLTTVLASCAPCGDINSRVSLRKMVPVQRKGWGEWWRMAKTGFSFVLREFFHQTWIIRCLIRGFCDSVDCFSACEELVRLIASASHSDMEWIGSALLVHCPRQFHIILCLWFCCTYFGFFQNCAGLQKMLMLRWMTTSGCGNLAFSNW